MRRIASLCITLLLLTGCWSRSEIDELVFPLALGIDKTENGYLVTIQVALPPKGEMAAGGGFWLESVERPTLDEAAHVLTLKVGNRPRWSHLALVVFGRDLAEAGVAPAIDYLVRVLELRESALVAVSHERASDILGGRLAGQTIPGVGYKHLLNTAFQDTMQPAISLARFAAMLMQPGQDPFAAMVRLQENGSVFFTDVAVFKHDTMVRMLDSAETRGFLRSLPGQQHAMVPFSCPDGVPAFVRNDGLANRLIPVLRGPKVERFFVQIRMTGYLTEGMCRGKLTDVEHVATLQRQVEKVVREEAKLALDAAREAGADIFGFGMRAYRKGGRIPGGNDAWTELPIEFQVDITLDREGITVNQNGIKRRRP